LDKFYTHVLAQNVDGPVVQSTLSAKKPGQVAAPDSRRRFQRPQSFAARPDHSP
jgi:hypothetical protein